MAESVKERANSVIDNLPEDSTMDDIMHVLYIQTKLERAENSVREGKGISHEEAKKILQKWLK